MSGTSRRNGTRRSFKRSSSNSSSDCNFNLIERVNSFTERKKEPNKTKQDKKDEKEKGGGKRKRRGAYSSGRREMLGFKKKRPSIAPNLSKSMKSGSKKKRTISDTPFASSHRWKKR